MAGYAALISGPKVFTFHGLVDRDLLASSRGARWGRAARWLTARLLRFVEDCSQNVIGNVITISPYVKEALPGIARNQLFEIPNPIDRMYCEMPWQNAHASREPIILTVGRIGPRKNTLESIRIASHLLQEDQNAQHVICGSLDSAEYMAACDAAARAAGVRNRVHFLGNLPVPELIRWLDRASCLLMTSKQETAPLAISEATSRGVVAIAPYDFGIKYMICEGENGLFLPEGDTKAKSNILRLAMDRSWDRNAISARARGIYAPSAVAAATMAAYRTILASN
jgi:glycosyltransferase involved in cell wall biosynthesis